MGQLGFFDTEKRLAALSAKGDPLEAIDRLVPWESFRAEIEAVVLTPDELKKSSAGRKPFDAMLMFRMLVLIGAAFFLTLVLRSGSVGYFWLQTRCGRSR